MNERSTCTVSLGILSFVVLQILVLFNKLPESLTVGIACELYLGVVFGNVHKVVFDSVAVDITVVEETVAGRRVAGVEQAEMLLGILVADACYETVGNDVGRVLQRGEVRPIDSVES